MRRRLLLQSELNNNMLFSFNVEDTTKKYDIIFSSTAGIGLKDSYIVVATIPVGSSSTGIIKVEYGDEGLRVNKGADAAPDIATIGSSVIVMAHTYNPSTGEYKIEYPDSTPPNVNNFKLTAGKQTESNPPRSPYLFFFKNSSGGGSTRNYVSFATTRDVNVRIFKYSHGNQSSSMQYVNQAPYVSRTSSPVNGKYIFSVPVESNGKIKVNTIDGNLTTTEVDVGWNAVLYVYDSSGNYINFVSVELSHSSTTQFDSSTSITFQI